MANYISSIQCLFDELQVECITSPPQPQASDGPHTVHRPATDVHV